MNPLINTYTRVNSTRKCEFTDLGLGLSGFHTRYKCWPQKGFSFNKTISEQYLTLSSVVTLFGIILTQAQLFPNL